MPRKINSVKDSSDSHPWYELTVNGNVLSVTADKDGATEFDMSGTVLDLNGINPSESFRIVVTESGELTTYNLGDDLQEPLRAHLSDPTTISNVSDNLYEFVERP